MQLIYKLLAPYFFMQTCDVDLEAEVSQIGQSAPFIVITGIPGKENA